MATELKKRLIGVEDIDFSEDGGNNPKSYKDRNGNHYQVHPIKASDIPLSSATREALCAGQDGTILNDVEGALVYLKEHGGGGSGSESGGGDDVMQNDTNLSFNSGDVVGSNNIMDQINGLSKDLGGHTLTIDFNGETYTLYESISLAGFYNGKIVLNGDGALFNDGTSGMGSIFLFTDDKLPVEVKSITFHQEFEGTKYGVKAIRCPYLYFYDCTFQSEDGIEGSAGIGYYLSCGIEDVDCIFENEPPRKVFDSTQSSGGRNVFDVFYSMSATPPAGAYDLGQGTLLENCNTTHPAFWRECVVRKASGGIRCVSENEWQNELESNGGSIGAFVIDETNFTVRLPKIIDYLRGGTNEQIGTYLENTNRKSGPSGITGGYIDIPAGTDATGGGFEGKALGLDWIYPGQHSTGTPVRFPLQVNDSASFSDESRPNTIYAKLYIQVDQVSFSGDSTAERLEGIDARINENERNISGNTGRISQLEINQNTVFHYQGIVEVLPDQGTPGDVYTLPDHREYVFTGNGWDPLGSEFPTNLSSFQNDVGYVTENKVVSLVEGRIQSLPPVSKTGNYNDLTNKPTLLGLNEVRYEINSMLRNPPDNITAQGNSFNHPGELLKLDADGKVSQDLLPNSSGAGAYTSGAGILIDGNTIINTGVRAIKIGNTQYKPDSNDSYQVILPAPNIKIGTVTTGVSGTDANASINGTYPNQTLNLTLPRGADGPAGAKGDPGTTNYNELTGLPVHIIETWHSEDGKAWYRRYSDNWVEQGGYDNTPVPGGARTVNFPVPFNSDIYTLSLSRLSVLQAPARTEYFAVNRHNAASFTTGGNDGSNDWNFSWFACGYAA